MYHNTLSVCYSDCVFQFYCNFNSIYKTGKPVYMVTNQLNDNFVFVTVIVQVFSREVDVNKWEIVCVVLEKRAGLRVSRNVKIFTHVFLKPETYISF